MTVVGPRTADCGLVIFYSPDPGPQTPDTSRLSTKFVLKKDQEVLKKLWFHFTSHSMLK